MDQPDSQAALIDQESVDERFDFEEAFAGTSTKDQKNRRWLLKILAGPNSGAQMNLEEGKSYLVGSESGSCDIVLTDLSVSKQHLKLTVAEDGSLNLADLNSRNGVLVNGEKIETLTAQTANVLATLGSTTLMLVDRNAPHKKTISPPIPIRERALAQSNLPPVGDVSSTLPHDQKKTAPPLDLSKGHQLTKNRPLIACAAALALLFLLGIFTLMRDPVSPPSNKSWENQTLADLLESYPFTFTFNTSDESVVLRGHTASAAQRDEVIAKLETLPFVERIDSRALVVDDSLCREFNQVLKNSWPQISLTSQEPGQFVLKGLFSTQAQMDKLNQYLSIHFPYFDQLKSDILVIDTATEQINRRLEAIAPGELLAQFSGQELLVVGTLPMDKDEIFKKYLVELKSFAGISGIQNMTTLRSLGQDDESAVDLSNRYKVTGSTARSGIYVSVAISGRILQRGDALDGMTVISIQADTVLLQRGSVKYKINYKIV